MSIYRNLSSAALHDLRLVDEDAGGAIGSSAEAGSSAPPRPLDWSQLRRAAPANELLKGTVAWYSAMPLEIQPKALVAKYPRIANALCAAWRDPQSFKDYMDELLMDRRGQRQGFPADVLKDLLTLRTHYHLQYPDAFNAWQAPVVAWDRS